MAKVTKSISIDSDQVTTIEKLVNGGESRSISEYVQLAIKAKLNDDLKRIELK